MAYVTKAMIEGAIHTLWERHWSVNEESVDEMLQKGGGIGNAKISSKVVTETIQQMEAPDAASQWRKGFNYESAYCKRNGIHEDTTTIIDAGWEHQSIEKV